MFKIKNYSVYNGKINFLIIWINKIQKLNIK